MEYYLTVMDRKVIDTLALWETVGLKIMPLFISEITLIEIDVSDMYFKACFG